MKALIQYTFSCTNAMFNFLKDEDTHKLLSKLREIEEHAKENMGGEDAELWFKFGKNDSLATDIRDIDATLKLPHSHSNRKYLIEQFESIIGLEPDNELRVFFS